MKQFSKSCTRNESGRAKMNADHRLGVEIHDRRMRLWAARSMAFP
jgi:hypothetical protein